MNTFNVEGHPLTVTIECPEFTCRCPNTGEPDFAVITITYTAHLVGLEWEGLKEYLETFREMYVYHEHVVQAILTALVAALDPDHATVEARFTPRGGMIMTTSASYFRRPSVSTPHEILMEVIEKCL